MEIVKKIMQESLKNDINMKNPKFSYEESDEIFKKGLNSFIIIFSCLIAKEDLIFPINIELAATKDLDIIELQISFREKENFANKSNWEDLEYDYLEFFESKFEKNEFNLFFPKIMDILFDYIEESITENRLKMILNKIDFYTNNEIFKSYEYKNKLLKRMKNFIKN